MGKLLFGVGINDYGKNIERKVNGKRVVCPFYAKWRDMLKRCYSEKYQSRYPSYIGCSVCSEWLTFSTFKLWMEHQDWKGKQLDKDLLVRGNKVYRPDRCVFVTNMVNNFMNHGGVVNADGLHGSFNHGLGRYTACCRNPITKTKEYLGSFNSKIESHEAWRYRKHEIAIMLSKIEGDPRVSKVLANEYAENPTL